MGKLNVKVCVLGMVSTNCYIVYKDNETAEPGTPASAVVIDPADKADYIAGQLEALNLKLEAILLTHGHFDHILAANELRKITGAPLYAGAGEKRLLGNPKLSGGPMGLMKEVVEPERWLQDGEELTLLGLTWKVMFTPGHTEGSVCYYVAEENVLFSGDTLFCRSFGRTDFPTGNTAELVKSITKKLFLLPEETSVCPGHESMTSIGAEKKWNPIKHYAR